MRVTVLLPGVLTPHAGGRPEVVLDLADGARVAAALDALRGSWPALGRRLVDDTGAVRRHVNLFVDGRDIRTTAGVDTPLADGTVLHVLPSVAGG